MGDLKKRVLAGCFLAPIVAAIFCFLPPLWFYIFLAAIAAIAFYEIAAMSGVKGTWLLVFLSVLCFIPLYSKHYHVYALWLLAAPLFYLIFRLLQGGGREEGINEEILKGTAVLLFGGVFIVLPFFTMYHLKELNTLFPFIILLALWASDICAYTVGKNFGKRLLAPQISPKKTVEGLLGAIFGSMIIIVLFHRLLDFGIAKALITGAVMGILGQAGDLLESAGKRLCHKKDSSNLIPGHGGILDRIDSFIFTAPFLYICTIWRT
ncbi:MAG: hypothetical protein C0399_08380 [Syntrophus sp. (in: bacteria)]|nr:hypothetical protein [Syntrophus sp. (in: bacteria)]